MVISCLGQTVFAFDMFITVGSSCFWKSISWRSSMMTSQPISRFFKFEAVSTRKFFNLRGESFWLSSQNHFNFGGEKQTPRTVLSSVCIWKLKQHTFSNEIYCRNPFALLQAVIQQLKPVNSQSTSTHSTLTQEKYWATVPPQCFTISLEVWGVPIIVWHSNPMLFSFHYTNWWCTQYSGFRWFK